MSEVDLPSLRDRLWHSMRSDLSRFAPEIANTGRLMCCCCGRLLEYADFDIEHLVPKQTLRADPIQVKGIGGTPKNARAGTILLCKKRLIYRNSVLYENGCNSWKGRFYDKPISDLFAGKAAPDRTERIHNTHLVGSLMLGFLAAFSKFGYVTVLSASGLLLRKQFFHPRNFLKRLGTRHQVILVGKPWDGSERYDWDEPFSFSFDIKDACIVTVRNFGIIVPMSHDPRMPIARHLKFVPSRFKYRPDFSTDFS